MFRATQDPVLRTLTFIRDYHPLWFHFPVDSEDLWLIYVRPTTPTMPKQGWFGLFPVRSPLLRESLIVFYSSGYLDVSVHRVSTFRWHVFNMPGYPIRKSILKRLFASQYGLSQLITSFIAIESLGIRQLPFVAYNLLYLLPVRQRTSFLVENIGVEPMTSCVQGRRSSQLS